LNDYGIPKAWRGVGAEWFGIPRARGDRAFWNFLRHGGLDEDAACGRVWIFSGIAQSASTSPVHFRQAQAVSGLSCLPLCKIGFLYFVRYFLQFPKNRGW